MFTKAEDKEMRKNVKFAENRADAIAASKDLWNARENRITEKWNARFRGWAEGQWGWKPEFRRYERQPVSPFRRCPTDHMETRPEAWPDIVLPTYQKMYGDTRENIEAFTCRMDLLRKVREEEGHAEFFFWDLT